jgi:hypothetical protein
MYSWPCFNLLNIDLDHLISLFSIIAFAIA